MNLSVCSLSQERWSVVVITADLHRTVELYWLRGHGNAVVFLIKTGLEHNLRLAPRMDGPSKTAKRRSLDQGNNLKTIKKSFELW